MELSNQVFNENPDNILNFQNEQDTNAAVIIRYY